MKLDMTPVVSATIVSRAAIKFGMSPDVAFSYSDYFINEIESCTSLQEIWDLQMALFLFYREEVKKSRDRTYFNTPTSMLVSYVENPIDTNLSLQEICSELSLDYKYASNCFKKDTGLGFNNAYYFTRTFKHTFGLSPYRIPQTFAEGISAPGLREIPSPSIFSS